MISAGARNRLPATLASEIRGSTRRAKPKGRVNEFEIVYPQKAK